MKELRDLKDLTVHFSVPAGERGGHTLNEFKEFRTEHGSSQGLDLALIGLFVLCQGLWRPPLQGYLAHKKTSLPYDFHRPLGICLL